MSDKLDLIELLPWVSTARIIPVVSGTICALKAIHQTGAFFVTATPRRGYDRGWVCPLAIKAEGLICMFSLGARSAVRTHSFELIW